MADGNSQPTSGRSLHFDVVQIEATNRCGYRCSVCPREEMTRRQGTMSLEDLRVVFRRVGPYAGVVLIHGFGEALLDRALSERVKAIRTEWPGCRIHLTTTLGVPMASERFEDIVRSGVDRIDVSVYGYSDADYLKIHGVDRFPLVLKRLRELAALKRRLDRELLVIARIERFRGLAGQGADFDARRAAFVKWLNDLGLEHYEGDLFNFGRGRAYNPPGRGGVCSVAWGMLRRWLSIDWQLQVVPCCYDFNSEIPFGNLRERSLEEIFSGHAHQQFIASHLTNKLDAYPLCAKCERNFAGTDEEREAIATDVVSRVNLLADVWLASNARIIVFGAGRHTRELLERSRLTRCQIVAIADGRPDGGPGEVGGYPTCRVEDIPTAHPDLVLLSSAVFEDDMRARLASLPMEGIDVVGLYGEP